MNLAKVIKHFGGKAGLAKSLGLSYQAVQQWEENNKIPHGRQYQIQVLTDGRFVAEQTKAA